MNAFDFFVTVALGASFGRILTARGVALVEAVAAFARLVSLQYAVTWLQVRSPRFARLIIAPPRSSTLLAGRHADREKTAGWRHRGRPSLYWRGHGITQ